MDMRMRVHNNNHLLKHLSAHDEVETCSIGVIDVLSRAACLEQPYKTYYFDSFDHHATQHH